MTHVLILFFVTFSAAFMATVPPGLLNMNAAKTSVEKGKLNGSLNHDHGAGLYCRAYFKIPIQ